MLSQTFSSCRLIVVCIIPVFLCWGCKRDELKPSVVLITLDTTRADHLSIYGYDRPTTPNLRAFSTDAVVFGKCQATAPHTLPGHASILTGLYPTRHGAHDQLLKGNLQPLAPGVKTLAMYLAERGYKTFAFVNNTTLTRHFNLNKGFDIYDDFFSGAERLAAGWVPEMQAQLNANRNRPFFVWGHFIDPHAPYDPHDESTVVYGTLARSELVQYPLEEVERHKEPLVAPPSFRELDRIVRLYDGELLYVDRWLERVFSQLKDMGLWDESIIIVTADHGEEFLEHGKLGHDHTLYSELLSVPLLIKFPKQRFAGSRVEAPCSSVDILPTVLDILGVAPSGDLDGRTLLTDISTGVPLSPVAVFSERHFLSSSEQHLYALRIGEMKLIRTESEMGSSHKLFSLSEDPAETWNRFEEMPHEARTFVNKMDLFLKRLIQHRQPPSATVPLTPELLEQLRSLGYAE